MITVGPIINVVHLTPTLLYSEFMKFMWCSVHNVLKWNAWVTVVYAAINIHCLLWHYLILKVDLWRTSHALIYDDLQKKCLWSFHICASWWVSSVSNSSVTSGGGLSFRLSPLEQTNVTVYLTACLSMCACVCVWLGAHCHSAAFMMCSWYADRQTIDR